MAVRRFLPRRCTVVGLAVEGLGSSVDPAALHRDFTVVMGLVSTQCSRPGGPRRTGRGEARREGQQVPVDDRLAPLQGVAQQGGHTLNPKDAPPKVLTSCPSNAPPFSGRLAEHTHPCSV